MSSYRTLRRTLAGLGIAVVTVTASGVPAHATGGSPPFVIVSATPSPGATDVAAAGDGTVVVRFSADLVDFPAVTVVDATTGRNITMAMSLRPDRSTLVIYGGQCGQMQCTPGFAPATTYTVTIGDGGRLTSVRSVDGDLLSGSDVAGISVGKGTATYSFTTAAAG